MKNRSSTPLTERHWREFERLERRIVELDQRPNIWGSFEDGEAELNRCVARRESLLQRNARAQAAT